ncbi:MAG: glycoside hydrolase family 97 protein, partial [Prevotella sp.]|nr:glycoside hydrolase family 97 protein [Prevotella sp.]
NSYHIGFPQEGEQNGVGSVTPAVSLPAMTPWRTITIGSLANIVETTVSFDLVKPKYKASQDYIYGQGSWSWIIKMDPSCNFDEQMRYIDFSAAMGWQSVLIDAFWDRQIGYERMAELSRYAQSKGVGLYLWYNSNGSWNDAPQTPIGKMSDSRIRRQEMKWLHDNGIRGIKVDFFGGDKQAMMQLYEDILSDANDYGLLCIFHGCTLPRGWERMYPNYVASEAVLASENLHFGQGACDAEARNACIHPFVRNTVGAMDFGGSALNKFYGADNQHGTVRRTSDVYALATAVLFQSAVQHFALAPNNLTDAPEWAIDFMRKVPTTWDEVRFIDGYPGKYVILARRSGSQWYVVGINAEQQPLKKTLTLPMFDKAVSLAVYADDVKLQGSVKSLRIGKKQQITVTIPQNGGVVITNN